MPVKSELSIIVDDNDLRRKGRRMTAHNNFHGKDVSKTGSFSAKEGFRAVATSGTAIYLDPEIF